MLQHAMDYPACKHLGRVQGCQALLQMIAAGVVVKARIERAVAAEQKDANSVPFKRALLAAAAPGIGKARRRKAEGESGMVLPFEPFNMTFHHVEYFVDLPSVRAFWLDAICICALAIGQCFRSCRA